MEVKRVVVTVAVLTPEQDVKTVDLVTDQLEEAENVAIDLSENSVYGGVKHVLESIDTELTGDYDIDVVFQFALGFKKVPA